MTVEADKKVERVYPLRSDHRPAPRDAPESIRAAFEDACAVFPLSPNGAALLARRTLQLTLRECVPLEQRGSLKQEIDAVRPLVSPTLVEGLHGLRIVCNEVAHPSTDADVPPVERDESHLTLELLADLLHQLFATPASARKLEQHIQRRKRASD